MARTLRQKAALRKAQLASARKRRRRGGTKKQRRRGNMRFARNLAIGVGVGYGTAAIYGRSARVRSAVYKTAAVLTGTGF